MTTKQFIDSSMRQYRDGLARVRAIRATLEQTPLGEPLSDSGASNSLEQSATAIDRVVKDSDTWLPGKEVEPPSPTTSPATSPTTDVRGALVAAAILLLVGIWLATSIIGLWT